jgi:hypothetical protein
VINIKSGGAEMHRRFFILTGQHAVTVNQNLSIYQVPKAPTFNYEARQPIALFFMGSCM